MSLYWRLHDRLGFDPIKEYTIRNQMNLYVVEHTSGDVSFVFAHYMKSDGAFKKFCRYSNEDVSRWSYSDSIILDCGGPWPKKYVHRELDSIKEIHTWPDVYTEHIEVDVDMRDKSLVRMEQIHPNEEQIEAAQEFAVEKATERFL